MLAPVLAAAALVLGPSPDVPYIDDFDTIAGFLRLYDDTPSVSGKLSLLAEQHNEHRMLLPRMGALFTRALHGHLDFGSLNAFGSAWLLLFVLALFLGFRRGEAPADKLLAFAPAVLLLVHPAFHMMFRSPTTSHSGFGVAACAALAFAALDRGGARRLVAAAALTLVASLTLANGFLIAPIGLVVLLLRQRWKQAAAWAVAGSALLAFYFGVVGAPASRADPALVFSEPARLITYALNFAGCAPGFRQPGVSLVAGALILVALAGALIKGLPRRSPALFGTLLFLLASLFANALARVEMGPNLPLLQPRYAFYSAALLALAYLGWAEVARDARRSFALALIASVAFCSASFFVWGDRVGIRSEKLATGYEQWWTRGDGGLYHPDYRSADAALLQGLEAGWLRVPAEWLERFAAWPVPRDAPAADQAVRFGLDVVNQDERAFYVSGWAHAGSTTRDQRVELVLQRPGKTLVFPATSVARGDLDKDDRSTALRARTGFRSLIPKQALPPGRYRLGILVRRAGREHLSYALRPVEVRPAGVK